MRSFFELGPVPVDEDAAQLGVDVNFDEQNSIECAQYKAQLQRTFPDAVFMIKAFPYEGAVYREVCVIFDDEDDRGIAMMQHVEANAPTNWDAEAVAELERLGYEHLNTTLINCGK